MTVRRHVCPGVHPDDARAVADVLRRNGWIMGALGAVDGSGLPDAWVGAGAIRDVVWGDRYGRFDAADVRDIDVAYFDPADLSRERDLAAQQALTDVADLPWEATNQAGVHTWYHEYFGGPPVGAFGSVHDAVATWPELATCVAVRLAGTGNDIEVCSPHGLDDLLGGVWRVNPVRVTPDISVARLARQRVRTRWPGVTIVPPG
ncbi:MAG TPA: nucleotidyltransferase family protein [Streptosporangiaceae bacterium]|nr:nucleotidyltransferase family protein [Streptosporangiaceae bacterium]